MWEDKWFHSEILLPLLGWHLREPGPSIRPQDQPLRCLTIKRPEEAEGPGNKEASVMVTLSVEMSTSSLSGVILLSILDFLLTDVINILSAIIKMPFGSKWHSVISLPASKCSDYYSQADVEGQAAVLPGIFALLHPPTDKATDPHHPSISASFPLQPKRQDILCHPLFPSQTIHSVLNLSLPPCQIILTSIQTDPSWKGTS